MKDFIVVVFCSSRTEWIEWYLGIGQGVIKKKSGDAKIFSGANLKI